MYKTECFCAHEFLNIHYMSVFIKLNIVAFINLYTVRACMRMCAHTHTHTHTHTHILTHICVCVCMHV